MKHSTKKNGWLYFLLVVILFFSFECSLWGSYLMFPKMKYLLSAPWERNIIPDPVLGKRMSPYYSGHDRRGYRNGQALDETTLLAIGDSTTYGFAAPPEGSWPSHLARITGKTTYNAAVGGYGPCEYEGVLNELIDLNPETVILGLYLGSDLANAYKSVYMGQRCKHLALKKNTILEDIKREDEISSLTELASKRLGHSETSRNSQIGSPIWNWLFQFSSLFRLGRSVSYSLESVGKVSYRQGLDDSFTASAGRPNRVMFDSVPQFRTVFRDPTHDMLALNVQDARIREGLRITQAVISSFKEILGKKISTFL